MYIVWKPFQLNFARTFLSAASHQHSAHTAHGCPRAQLVARSCFARMCAQVPARHGSAHIPSLYYKPSTSLRPESRASKDLGISYSSFALQKGRHVESRRTLPCAHRICAHVLKSACAYRFYAHNVLVQAYQHGTSMETGKARTE